MAQWSSKDKSELSGQISIVWSHLHYLVKSRLSGQILIRLVKAQTRGHALKSIFSLVFRYVYCFSHMKLEGCARVIWPSKYR